jgi:uncharacterized protein
MATLILKVTEKCNSNCYYCDVINKKETGKSLPLNLLQQLFRRIDEYLKENPRETVELLWHGGEPLLVGVDYFNTAVDYQESYCPQTRERIRHSIQTNLTCFHSGFLEVFDKLNIRSVGTSYDPESHIRGPGKRRDTHWYNSRFLEALRILEENQIGWGIIYVVTRKSLKDPLKVFYHLTNLLLSGGVNFNPVLIYDESRQDIAITPKEYVEFLGTIFPYWWKNRNRYPGVNPFKALTDTIINGHISLGCVDSGQCTYHHINISPDGETSQCGRSADWGLLQYGNIKDITLSEILSDSQRDELDKRLNELQKGECMDCRFWDICHGGCPLDSYSKHKSFMHKSEWCEAKREFITKYFEPITGVKYEKRNLESQ